jgi:2-keto-3-deoxy-L-rhamnonate aldolase RhmA
MSTTSSSQPEDLPMPVTPEQKFKTALHAGRRVYGTLVTSTSPRSLDAVAGVGLDCVFIDTEHIPLNWHDLGWMCRAYRGIGLAPIVRIPRADPFDACRVLDVGARGIVAAYVETADEVRALRGAVKLRPLKGKRLAEILSGEPPLKGELARYVEQYNRDHVMLVNIESVAAIEALDSILAVPDLDGLLIGPHDLSCSLGIPEQYDHPLFEEAVHAIIASGRAKGVGVGMHNLPKVEQDIRYAKAGLNLILRMSDLMLFRRGLMEDLGRLKAGLGDTGLTETSAHITI